MAENEVQLRAISERCCQALAALGIHDEACLMILYYMVAQGGSYYRGVRLYTAFANKRCGVSWSVERFHSEVCYRVLKAGIQQHPEALFGDLARKIAGR